MSVLADAGLLEVEGEQRVHGAVERHYRLQRSRVVIDKNAAEAMSLEDHRKGFTATMAALHAEFNAYLDRHDADPKSDSVSYKQFPLLLSKDELDELIGQFVAAIAPQLANEPTPERSPHLLSTIFFPTHKP